MSDSKNSMIFFYDWQNLFEELDDAEVGQLVLAALKYDQTGEDTRFPDKGMRVAFKAMKNSIKVSNEKYQTACEKKREAMERRWKKNRNVYTSIDNYREASDTDTDTVTDTHTVTVTDTVTDTDTGSSSRSIAADAAGRRPRRQFEAEAIRIWNSQSCTQPIKNITTHRAAQISECDSPDEFLHTIRDLDQQKYLREEAEKGKKVKFDWFIQQENYNKVLEGNYKDSYDRGGGHGSIWD